VAIGGVSDAELPAQAAGVGFQWARRIDDGRTEADMDGVCLRGIIDRLGLTGDGNLIATRL
jgi:hypothetical protein